MVITDPKVQLRFVIRSLSETYETIGAVESIKLANDDDKHFVVIVYPSKTVEVIEIVEEDAVYIASEIAKAVSGELADYTVRKYKKD